MNSPHDDLAKFLFAQISRAVEALKAALGPDISRLIDWSTLRAEPTELVDHKRGQRFADLRFSVKLQELDALIQVVFEHQSDVDTLMPVRFFCHTGAVWNSERQENRPAVHLVINVLLHTGPKPWSARLDLSGAIVGGQYLRENAPQLLPHLPIFIDDLATLSEESIRARGLTSPLTLALLILKNGRNGKALRALQNAADLVADTPDDVLRELVRYVLRVDAEASVASVSAALVGPLGSKGEEIAMTTGDRLIAEGEAKGLAKGLAKGKAEGKAEGRAEGKATSVLRLLAQRGLTPTAAQKKLLLGCQSQAQLDAWLDRSVTARTVDAVFASAGPARRPKPH